jgi:hypothetical protein
MSLGCHPSAYTEGLRQHASDEREEEASILCGGRLCLAATDECEEERGIGWRCRRAQGGAEEALATSMVGRGRRHSKLFCHSHGAMEKESVVGWGERVRACASNPVIS